MTLQRRLVGSLLLLLLVVAAAAIGYHTFGGSQVSALDAVYMAVITIATVGYGEVVDTSHNPPLRIFNMVVILFGIGVMLYVFSTSTAFIVEGELKDIFRRRKMLKQIRDLNHHLIVCGAGEIGSHVIRELLRTKNVFVAIDHDEARLERVRALGEFPTLQGDAADDEVLNTAGITRARGLASVLPEDKDNLMVVVTARQMNPHLRIVARSNEARAADKFLRAGANAAVSPNTIGGMRLASELVRPHVVSFLDLMLKEQEKTLRVEEISIGAESPWAGRTIRDTDMHRRFELLALAVRRPDGRMQYNPQSDTALSPGDVLVVMGDVDRIWKARQDAGAAAQSSTA